MYTADNNSHFSQRFVVKLGAHSIRSLIKGGRTFWEWDSSSLLRWGGCTRVIFSGLWEKVVLGCSDNNDKWVSAEQRMYL